MMLGPKSRATVSRLAPKSAGIKKSNAAPGLSRASSSSSSIKAPSASSSSLATAGTKLPAAIAANAAAVKRQVSHCSLLAAGKSTSRSSIISDSGLGRASPTQRAQSGTSSRNNSSTGLITRTVSAVSSSGIRTAAKTGPASLSSASTCSGTSSSASSASVVAARNKVPTLAMSLRDKDQQIKLLIKERDEQKFQAELMAQRAEDWEEKFMQSELERSHVTTEADDEVVELRRLAQELEDENKRLVERLGEQEQVASDSQFKLVELECERNEMRRELEDRDQLLEQMEREQRELLQGSKSGPQVTTERAQSKAKYEREIEELKEKILSRDEQLMQLKSSLEMRKNEVINLQTRAVDLERKLKIETERSERHLKRIDETNLELKAAEAKLATKTEENEIYEKQVRQLRQEIRVAEEKLETVSLARKKDVDILHSKLAASRRGSTTPTSPQPNFKTPTPQDEITRLQVEIRDLKDQLIDREAELDCNKRDMELMRRKMETRTLEVDCNNQELARRCQDLLEQNRQSEDTVKHLLRSTTEHSAQLMRATVDLKEANGKCVKLREEINELEDRLSAQLKTGSELEAHNAELKLENEMLREEVESLRQQVNSLSEQLADFCKQLDEKTNNLHKERENLANRLSQNEMDSTKMRQELNTAKQDLRTNKLQTQEVASERDRLRSDLELKEKYIASRNDIIETIRGELEDYKKSLVDHKLKLEELRQTIPVDVERATRELRAHMESLKQSHQTKADENSSLRARCDQLERELESFRASLKREEGQENVDELDQLQGQHRAELEELRAMVRRLEEELEDARMVSNKSEHELASSTLVRSHGSESSNKDSGAGSQDDCEGCDSAKDYQTQIEFLNSVVVDMQRKCDDYKHQLAQMETISIINEFDKLILSKQQQPGARDVPKKSVYIMETRAPAKQAAYVTVKQPVVTSKAIDKASRISGRPYCDRCNIYDLHHTVHCPIGAKYLPETILNNNNNNNSTSTPLNNNSDEYTKIKLNNRTLVDDMFKEYEESLNDAGIRQFCTIRRSVAGNSEKAPRPYCDHCDLFGHTVRSCASLRG